MKIETILNAVEDAWEDILWLSQFNQKYIQQIDRRKRQRKAFRSRIIRMDAEHMELAKVVNRLRIHRMNEDRLLAYDLAKKILKGRR